MFQKWLFISTFFQQFSQLLTKAIVNTLLRGVCTLVVLHDLFCVTEICYPGKCSAINAIFYKHELGHWYMALQFSLKLQFCCSVLLQRLWVKVETALCLEARCIGVAQEPSSSPFFQSLCAQMLEQEMQKLPILKSWHYWSPSWNGSQIFSIPRQRCFPNNLPHLLGGIGTKIFPFLFL